MSASRKRSLKARETVKKENLPIFWIKMFAALNLNVFDKFGLKLGRFIELYVHDVKRKKNMEIGEKQLFFSCFLQTINRKTELVAKAMETILH